ncbi:hypothetical protein RHSP_01063 [Rhizobium freirei PRF 81]|uniref:Methylaspartate ammonia-lyase n=1 Tax=Rhizobium freirei PRF 81 TaxID=363754 RepID=N6V824_9HYPH|nr:hypothetical protein [Rhizobium freirei]ENN89336.1 hypothetical protein RHSP_01063 [Rhizobium freirei PRF 81]
MSIGCRWIAAPLLTFALFVVGVLWTAEATGAATEETPPLGSRLCKGLSQQMDRNVAAPYLFQSYSQLPGAHPLDPMLSNAAFTYDNALATIALFACDRDEDAKRVANALVLAANHDRSYDDGRLRNAYRSGSVTIGKEGMLLPGFWKQASNSWVEDDYQAGSATGNLAWAALALLTAYDRTKHQPYFDAAVKVMRWVDAHAAAESGIGYTGGTFGHEPSPQKLAWKSTEQNLDVYAVANWLAEIDPIGGWERMGARARKFLDAMWNAQEGRFYVGSRPGSDMPNLDQSGIDAELWPVLAVPDFRDRYYTVLQWVDRHYSVDTGFDFNEDRDGIWLEGTAQAALTFYLAGQKDRARNLLATIATQIAPNDLVYATVGTELSTGLKVGADATSGDFKYYRIPHVGATAWAILAAKAWNPFLKESVGPHNIRE